MGQLTSRVPVVRVDGGRTVRRPDTLAVEEPLEIRVGREPLAVTMRTPGDDIDLAVGFLFTEGVITAAADVVSARHCQTGSGNVVEVSLAPDVPRPPARRFVVSSACGICGKDSIDAVRTAARWRLQAGTPTVASEVLMSLPERLRGAQRLFDRTGGMHAAALFTPSGELLAVREDVGRHNAVDKLVGWAAREGRLPLSGSLLQVSGRASFELTQKALAAGIPVLAAVGAPSSLAVELAAESGMTLVGFLRLGSFNVYAGAGRLGLAG